MGTLVYLAKETDIEKWHTFKKTSYDKLTDIFDNGFEYLCIDVDTPVLLTTQQEHAPPTNDGQATFKHCRSEAHERIP